MHFLPVVSPQRLLSSLPFPIPMKTNVRQISGPWNLGYTLDKHTINSTYTGEDIYGRATFDTTRTEVGEALYQLKYRFNHSQATVLAGRLCFPCGTSFRAPLSWCRCLLQSRVLSNPCPPSPGP